MQRLGSTFTVTCVALAVVLAGCGGDDPGASGADPATSPTAQTATSGSTPTSSTAAAGSTDAGVAAAVGALQTAARAVPNGRAFDLERETRGGQRVWEAKVASGQRQFDLAITADGVRPLTRRQDPTPDDDARTLRSVKVDAPRALRLAAQHQDGQVTDLDLDSTDAGAVVWEVDFRQPNGSTAVVGIHARTGKVVDVSDD